MARRRLRSIVFWWFAATILLTALTAGMAMHLFAPEPRAWRDMLRRGQTFIGHQFAAVWHDPMLRAELAAGASEDLGVEVVLRDPAGAEIGHYGPSCERHRIVADVERDGATLGIVEVCMPHVGGVPWWFVIGTITGIGTLWAGAGLIARRLARPVDRMGRFAQRIGDGDLRARVELDPRAPIELVPVARALDDMAARVERQISESRELLAAVSHEIRTPLGHLRVLTELLAEGGADRATVSDLERELVDLDDLVGKLLADARVQFSALSCTRLSARSLVTRALNHAGVSSQRLSTDGDDEFDGDPTLLARAIGNLLENAQNHGDGVDAVRVRGEVESVVVEVDDRGPGFGDDYDRAFEPFVRGHGGDRPQQSALGLGLALVRRIARAHGGDAFARPRPGGGATVGFSVRRPRTS